MAVQSCQALSKPGSLRKGKSGGHGRVLLKTKSGSRPGRWKGRTPAVCPSCFFSDPPPCGKDSAWLGGMAAPRLCAAFREAASSTTSCTERLRRGGLRRGRRRVAGNPPGLRLGPCHNGLSRVKTRSLRRPKKEPGHPPGHYRSPK